MADSAEAIAKVCADIRAGKARDILNTRYLESSMLELFLTSEIVDATKIYHDLTDRQKGVDVYADHILCPVWDSAFIGYLNQHGNVTIMHLAVVDVAEARTAGLWSGKEQWESFAEHTIDWDRVRWVYTTTVWLGGYSQTYGKMPTSGPLHSWTVAVYPDGEIADVRWVQLDTRPEADIDQWDMASLVWLGAVNLGNCVNVELREPVRPRATARRIARTGVRVNEIHVKPISASYRGKKGESATTSSVPLHTVRGHFAKYGPKYDRALLFGKYEGRYWIPQHARGVEEAGRSEHIYEMG